MDARTTLTELEKRRMTGTLLEQAKAQLTQAEAIYPDDCDGAIWYAAQIATVAQAEAAERQAEAAERQAEALERIADVLELTTSVGTGYNGDEIRFLRIDTGVP